MTQILQNALPYDVSEPAPLPGIQPLDPADLWIRDDAYDGQMAERDRLLRGLRPAVVAMEPTAEAAAGELLSVVLREVYDADPDGPEIRRPDGQRVVIDRSDPMATLGRLVQEDLCILQKQGVEHVLSAAVLCFPASWLLSEKIGRPLIGIHDPVDSYDSGIAARVQRLFDGVQVGRPLWRRNALWYDKATLHQPRSQSARRQMVDPDTAPYFRSERQAIFRLPQTRAVVFSIHTYVIERKKMPAMSGT